MINTKMDAGADCDVMVRRQAPVDRLSGQLTRRAGRTAWDSRCSWQRLRPRLWHRNSRPSDGFRLFSHAPRANETRYGSLFADPGRVENDYFRFLNYPRS